MIDETILDIINAEGTRYEGHVEGSGRANKIGGELYRRNASIHTYTKVEEEYASPPPTGKEER